MGISVLINYFEINWLFFLFLTIPIHQTQLECQVSRNLRHPAAVLTFNVELTSMSVTGHVRLVLTRFRLFRSTT